MIFSIGILVDDAIVIVENIVRHWRMPANRARPPYEVAIEAVDEVGNPTILATLTVVAAILPMAFVGGLMGPYMRPIPIGASAAMVFSLAVAALLTLAVHGSLWVALKTEGAVESRARRFANSIWWVLLVWVVLITFASFRIQPQLKESFAERPWGYVFPLLAILGLVGIRVLSGLRGGLEAFLCSRLFFVGMLTSAAFGTYPYVLPSNADPSLGLTVHNSAAPLYGLQVGLMWFIPGMVLACGYFVYTYRSFSGKVKLDGEGHY